MYVHTDDGKLKPRAKKGVFTGYPEEQKCIISTNIIFREDKVFKELSNEERKDED